MSDGMQRQHLPYSRGFKHGRLTHRHVIPADAPSLHGLIHEAYDGNYPMPDTRSPEEIRKTIEKRELIWIAALEGDKAVGTIATEPMGWNKSHEMCRGAVLPGYANDGIVTRLGVMIYHAAFQDPDCDLIYVNTRNPGIKKALEKCSPPPVVVGGDHGMHIVGDNRELHLLTFAFNPFKEVYRVVPVSASYESSSAITEINESVNLEIVVGEYPEDVVVGPEGSQEFSGSNGSLRYTYFEPSKTVLITEIDGQSSDMKKTIVDFLISRPDIEHVTLYVLADKESFIEELRKPTDRLGGRGFVRSAFLPAWFYREGMRFDCFNMSLLTGDIEPTHFFDEDLVSRLKSIDE